MERPSLFVNELELYVKHLAAYINNNVADLDNKKKKYINKFNAQLLDGIRYYRGLQEQLQQAFGESKANFLEQLNRYELQLKPLVVE